MGERHRSAIFFCFGIGLLLYLCFILRQALLLIYVSVLIAVLFYPLVKRIEGIRIWHWNPGVGSAVLLLFGAVLGSILLVLIFFVPRLLGDFKNLQVIWPQRLSQIEQWIHHTVPVLNIDTQQINDSLRKFASRIFQPQQITAGLIDFGAMLLAAAYFMVDGETSIHWLVSLFPTRSQTRVQNTLLRGGKRMQDWLSGQAILMAIHGASAFFVFWLLHIKYFYALAVFAGFINIIPVLGPIITVIVAGMIAAMGSFSKLLGVVIFFVIYHNVENAILNPRIMQSKVHIPAVTIIVALILGEEFAGIIGMLIAVPTAVLISVLVREYISSDAQDPITLLVSPPDSKHPVA
jgi:predicted PurR-regulated permease PerM